MAGKYRTYSEYKSAESKWLDVIPKHWSRSPLKNLVLIRITDGPHETPEFVDDGIPFLSAEAVKNNALDFSKKRGYITKTLHELYSKKCLPKINDIFMVKSGNTTGALAIVETDDEFNIWSPLALIRANRVKAIPKFIFYSMQSEFFQISVQLTWSQGTQPNIGMGVIENLHIAIAPLEEQGCIANFLDHETAKIDTLIEKQQQLIKLLKEKRQAVISHAVTKGLNLNARMRDSGVKWLGEVPEHWEVSKIKFYCSVKGRIGFRGYTVEDLVDKENGALVIGATEMNSKGEIILNSPQYISWMKYYESPEIMLEEGMILVVQRGSTVGKVANIPSGIGHATINPSLIVLRDLKINSHYLLYSIMGSAIQSLVKTQTSVTAIPMISQEQVGNYWLLIPPIYEQNEINAFINFQIKKTDDAINYSEKSIELLNERRTALISAAVTGKIDVRNWQAANG